MGQQWEDFRLVLTHTGSCESNIRPGILSSFMACMQPLSSHPTLFISRCIYHLFGFLFGKLPQGNLTTWHHRNTVELFVPGHCSRIANPPCSNTNFCWHQKCSLLVKIKHHLRFTASCLRMHLIHHQPLLTHSICILVCRVWHSSI